MTCSLLKIHIQAIRFPEPTTTPSPLSKTRFEPFFISRNHHQYCCHSSRKLSSSKSLHISRTSSPLSIHYALSSPSPPTSKEDAILQAKTSLSIILQKTLNSPRLTGKFKKQKRPRFRVEIPVIDDSPESITELALSVFSNLPVRKRGSPVKILLVWANPILKESANKAFDSTTTTASSGPVIEHVDLTTFTAGVDSNILNSTDVAMFLAPEASQLSVIKLITDDRLYPKPVVLFNPKWAFEEEASLDNELSSFAGSFDVVYAFLGLEVRGILSKRKGVVFKCVRDGILTAQKWNVLVEEGDELKVVSRFTSRPSMAEVENVLYNLMAVNSPVTKSAKFFKDLVSNVTGRK